MVKKVELEPRLQMIYEMIPNCSCLCDIGTDHAYIPIRAALEGICEKIIATDINEGPITIAKANIAAYGVDKKIETRVGNGFDCVSENECDVALICGMGGLTITTILQTQWDKVIKCNQLIIQCMYASEMVRELCYQKGLEIVEERICSDKNKIYTAMRIKPTLKPKVSEPLYNYVSEPLLSQKNELVIRYISQLVNRLKGIKNGHENAKEKDLTKINFYKEIIAQLNDKKR